LNLRGIGGLKTEKDQDDKPTGTVFAHMPFPDLRLFEGDKASLCLLMRCFGSMTATRTAAMRHGFVRIDAVILFRGVCGAGFDPWRPDAGLPSGRRGKR